MKRFGPTLVRYTRGGKIERIFRDASGVLVALRDAHVHEAAFHAAAAQGFPLLEVLGPVRRTRAAVARQEVIVAVIEEHDLSVRRAALLFGLDRTTIRWALKSVYKRRRERQSRAA